MASGKQFTHLHVHSSHSMLDGLALIPQMVAEAERLGMPAIALTDHGTMAAAYDLHKVAQGSSVKPIFGIEAYLSPAVPRSHREPVRWNGGGDDDVSGAGAYTHMTMLAATNEGLHNLFRLSSESYLTGMYRKPRMDEEILAEHAHGIIATTGCPSGEVQTWLRIGDYEKALAAAAKFRDIFDAGNFYVEVMDHGLDIERRVIKDLLRIAKDLSLPVVATNDLHYVKAADAPVHEALLCVSSGSLLSDPDRFKFTGNDYYLKSAEEMRRIWDGEVPEACDNTLRIAEQCEAVFAEGHDLMPQFPVPAGQSEEEFFAAQVRAGIKARYPDGVPQDRRERADFEIDVITKMGFAGYFLVVADFINWAKEQGIRVGPGRGSAAGSIVSYGLGITELDPIENGLLFERFLNPERVSPPDIDIDFDDRRRAEVIDYVRSKYGEDKVAHIATFGTIKAKAAMKDAARVLGYPYALGDRLTKAYPPPIVGRDLSLAGAYDPSHDRYKEAADFRKLVEADPDAKKVVDLARGLEGVKRGFGMHAAGVIMSREPIVDHVPLMKRDADSPVMTQFEYPTCESLGLIKMDFLGLSNLFTIDTAIRLIEANRGVTVKVEDIWADMTDQPTFDLLASGDTLGVFQLDSPPIRSLLRLMAPDRFNDVSAVLALYRPGPMGAGTHIDYADRKNGRKPVAPIHPEFAESLADILDDTYGLIVYQEQVMAIAQRVAGYTLGQADLLRRAMGKKKKEILDKEFAPFAEASKKNGYSDGAIQALWDILVPFSDYAFNRCVDGDTVVSLGAAGSSSDGTATVRSLYDRLHLNLLPTRRRGEPASYEGPCLHCRREDRPAVWRGRCRACKSWVTKFRNTGLTALALDTDGRVRPKRIKDVHYNGTRACYTVTLADGRSITATENHRHMTDAGWRRVDEIRVGDRLLVATPDTTSVHLKYDYRLTDERPTYRAARLAISERHGENSLGWVNGASVALAEWTRTQEKVCTEPGCGRSAAAGDRIERAHLDGDRRNNTPENLRMLCVSHHKQWDYANNGRTRRWEAGHLALPVEVVSIEYAGEREVYDLEMDDPGHNWVGNGIITHNSHSAAYGYISYATAWLKANYPTEFMAALLTTNSDDKDKVALYLSECRRMGIKVLPPSVNVSTEHYTADGDNIRVGLVSIRHVGEKAVRGILQARAERGRFTGFGDFLASVPSEGMNRRLVESLVASGAFDEFGHTRNALHAVHEDAVKRASAAKKKITQDQDSLFDVGGCSGIEFTVTVPDLPEWSKNYLLSQEREMLGLYVSDHPLNQAEHLLRKVAPRSLLDIRDSASEAGADTRMAGLITAIQPKRTKKGDAYVVLTVEDLDTSLPVYVFPRTYAEVADILAPDRVVRVDGRVERRDDGSVSVTANRVALVNLSEVANPDSVPVVLRYPQAQFTQDVIDALKSALAENAGPSPVHLRLIQADGAAKVFALGPEWTVARGVGLISAVKAVLGPSGIVPED